MLLAFCLLQVRFLPPFPFRCHMPHTQQIRLQSSDWCDDTKVPLITYSFRYQKGARGRKLRSVLCAMDNLIFFHWNLCVSLGSCFGFNSHYFSIILHFRSSLSTHFNAATFTFRRLFISEINNLDKSRNTCVKFEDAGIRFTIKLTTRTWIAKHYIRLFVDIITYHKKIY